MSIKNAAAAIFNDAVQAKVLPVRKNPTVTIDDIDFGDIIGSHSAEVEFTYYAGERATRDEPGCPEEWEILSVNVGGLNIWPIICGEDDMYTILKEAVF